MLLKNGKAQLNTLAKAATDDAKLEEKQSSQVVKALVEEQKVENQADNAIVQSVLQQAMNQANQPETPASTT